MKNKKYYIDESVVSDIFIYKLNECIFDQEKIQYYFEKKISNDFYLKNIKYFKNGIYFFLQVISGESRHSIWATKDDNGMYKQGIHGPILKEIDKELFDLLYKK